MDYETLHIVVPAATATASEQMSGLAYILWQSLCSDSDDPGKANKLMEQIENLAANSNEVKDSWNLRSLEGIYAAA